MTSSENFYINLTGFKEFNKFVDISFYKEVPNDWHVAVADVEGSTKEINAGRYREVNSVGASSIAAVLNAVKPLKIPFVFGGDGAVFCIPSSELQKTQSALLASKVLAKDNLNMNLRVGTVPIEALTNKGFKVFTAKYQPTDHYQQTMFRGRGIAEAERMIKSDTEEKYAINEIKIKPIGSFEGFECRWNEIPSPHEETINLLVQSLKDEEDSGNIYTEITERITQLYGEEENHHPIRKELLSLSFSFKKLYSEASIRTTIVSNLRRFLYILKLMLLNLIGKWYMWKNKKTKNTDWGKYKERLITNTDFRKFDDALRMVIAGTKVQRARLTFYLEQLRLQGKIVYGIHSSPNSLVTCLVEDYNLEHVHFLDGSTGGYALAALKLKEQLNEMSCC